MSNHDDNLPSSGPQSLARSLQILAELAASAEPISATALAEKVGLHQSSVSRILSTLQAAGFVRKPDYHHFCADYGLLSFAAKAIHQFPLIQHTLPVLRRLAPACAPMLLTVATLWRNEVLYLVRVHAGSEPTIMPLMRFPLHLSSPGLRMLLDRPGDEALTALEHSAAELGWDRPTGRVAATPAALLKEARGCLELDVLALDGWQAPEILTAAIPIRLASGPGGKPAPLAALSISGLREALPLDRIRTLLHQGAREIETALAQTTATAFAP